MRDWGASLDRCTSELDCWCVWLDSDTVKGISAAGQDRMINEKGLDKPSGLLLPTFLGMCLETSGVCAGSLGTGVRHESRQRGHDPSRGPSAGGVASSV